MSVYYLEKYLIEIKKEISEVEAMLNSLPEGKLIVTHSRKNYTKWYEKKKSEYHYIPKKKRRYAEELAYRKYLLEKRKELQKEHECIEKCIGEMNSITYYSKALCADYKYSELIKANDKLACELKKWEENTVGGNPLYNDNLKYKTMSGCMVRSKSEVLIADELWSRRIPFVYECPVILSEGTYYPDFVIRHPKTGKTKYWEHFGMMDNMNYVQKCATKIKTYSENGIIPSVDLIMTFETEDSPLDITYVCGLIEFHFGCESF